VGVNTVRRLGRWRWLFFWTSLIGFVLAAVIFILSFFYSIKYTIQINDLPPTFPPYYAIYYADRGVLARLVGYGNHQLGAEIRPSIPGWNNNYSLKDRLVPRRFSIQSLPTFNFLFPLWIPMVPFALVAFTFRFARHLNRPGYCEGCGYDLFGIQSATCPECGVITKNIVAMRIECANWLACPYCRLATAETSDGVCTLCNYELKPEEVRWEAFHSRPIRLFASDKLEAGVQFLLASISICLSPRRFWKSMVFCCPPSLSMLITIWVAWTFICFLILQIPYDYEATMWRGSIWILLIAVAVIPVVCCLAVLVNRRYIRSIGIVSTTYVFLCYVLTMPIFAIGCLFTTSVLSLTRGHYPDVCGLSTFATAIASFGCWTLVVLGSFQLFRPVQKVSRRIIPSHTITLLLTCIVVMGGLWL